MNELGLRLSALQKRFGDNRVVRGLSLELTRGEIVALLGPSGCGKTTALRMVSGLERPDSGEIDIAGQRVFGQGTDLPPEARNIGMVFQSYAVWPHRSILENVAYPLRLKKDPEAKARAEQALELVRLPGMGERLPSTLSGGQQQRVALARALVAKPALLLFDEPLSNLDAKLREDMRHEIRQLAKSVGTTSLYVTHDQPEAFAVSDRVAVVLQGVIAQIAPPAELYARPCSLEVARFVGRLSVLERVERAGEGLVRLGGKLTVAASFAEGAGDALVLGVRPEAARVEPGDQVEGLPGRVLRCTFLGERSELVIETDCGELRVDVRSTMGLEEGAQVRIRLFEGRAYPRA